MLIEEEAEANRIRDEEGEGILGWLSPFKKEKKKTPEELAAEDPHDDIYRAELAAAKQKLFLKLNPPEEIKEEVKQSLSSRWADIKQGK